MESILWKGIISTKVCRGQNTLFIYINICLRLVIGKRQHEVVIIFII